MGLCITGVKLKEKKDGDMEACVASERFSRSLLSHETFKCDSEEIFGGDCDVADCLGVSYGTYNDIRDYISRYAIGKPSREVWGDCSDLKDNEPYPHPLCHIINFSDCEGFIGPKAVKEMAEYLQIHECEIYEKFKKDHDEGEDTFYSNVFINLSKGIRETARHGGYLFFS